MKAAGKEPNDVEPIKKAIVEGPEVFMERCLTISKFSEDILILVIPIVGARNYIMKVITHEELGKQQRYGNTLI